MFNRSIVSVGRAADSPLGRSTPLLKFGGGGILLLLSHPVLLGSLRLLSPSTPPPHLYAYSFICWWLIPHYRDRSTDKRNVLGNTQCAPPWLSRSFSRPSATGGKGMDEDEDEAASGAGTHILCVRNLFFQFALRPRRLFSLFPLSSLTLRRK